MLPGPHDLLVPVGAFHEPDVERTVMGAGPRQQVAEVGLANERIEANAAKLVLRSW